MKERIKKFRTNYDRELNVMGRVFLVAGGVMLGYQAGQYMNEPVRLLEQTHKDTGKERMLVINRNGNIKSFTKRTDEK